MCGWAFNYFYKGLDLETWRISAVSDALINFFSQSKSKNEGFTEFD